MEIENLLIVGLGLLGGSVALAARERGIARHIVAHARPGRDHEQARADGLIDAWSHDLAGEAARADFILIAQPVDSIVRILPTILAAASEGALVTDVGSTKATIVEKAGAVATKAHFVGSHPMAGSHLTGWKNGRANLFQGATTYVTPTESTCMDATGRVTRFWQSLGSRPVLVDPVRHDHLCALVSHVPHLVAVALMELLGESCEDPHFLRVISGPGLRDTTRIAMGSPDVWQEICHHNSKEISVKLHQLAEICHQLADKVGKGDESLRATLGEASRIRSLLEKD